MAKTKQTPEKEPEMALRHCRRDPHLCSFPRRCRFSPVFHSVSDRIVPVCRHPCVDRTGAVLPAGTGTNPHGEPENHLHAGKFYLPGYAADLSHLFLQPDQKIRCGKDVTIHVGHRIILIDQMAGNGKKFAHIARMHAPDAEFLTPEQAKKMADQSDGAIVGSAIVKLCGAYGKDCVPKVKAYVKEMKDAIR